MGDGSECPPAVDKDEYGDDTVHNMGGGFDGVAERLWCGIGGGG